MTDAEKQEIVNEIVAYLIANSQQVSGIPIATNLDDISSLPAIKQVLGQEDEVVRAPISLLVPSLRFDEQTFYIQYRNGDGPWINLFYTGDIHGGGSAGTGSYINPNLIVQKVGGILKGSDFTTETNLQVLLDKMLFPNYGKQFPSNPVFIGFVESTPTTQQILNLEQIHNFNEFDYNKYTAEGHVIIALPATYYLKRIEDDSGMNIIGSFDLVYKSMQSQALSDIYNVYVSPKLFYNDNLELTFTTKTGNPVQVTLNSGTISVNDITPTVNSITIKEAVKSIIKSIKITQREVPVLLNSISLSRMDIQPVINSLSIGIRDINPILKSIDIQHGVKSILKGISISQGYHSNINSISITEAIKSKINSISIKDGRAILNSVSIKQADRAIINSISISKGIKSELNNISIKEGKSILKSISINEATKSIINNIKINEATKSILNNISIKEGKAILNNIYISEAIKSNINNISIKDGRSIVNSIYIKEGSSKLKSIQIKEATKAIINSITIKEYN